MTQPSVTLLNLCRHAATALDDGSSAGELFEELTVIRGRHHQGDARPGWLYSPGREPEPLQPGMAFTDAYMRLEYIAHVPILLLFFHDTQEQLAEGILGEGGYFNPFTTMTIAFRNGLPAPFECTHAGEDGTREVFCKEMQHHDNDAFGKAYLDTALTWLPPASS